MARYGHTFKFRAVARLLPPQSAALEVVSREVGIGAVTLQLWHDDAQCMPARGRACTARGRFEAVITTAAMDESGKTPGAANTACTRLSWTNWHTIATAALAEPEKARAIPQATRHDKKRINELERELLRKDRALAETAALLVLSKSRGDVQQKRGRMIGLEDRQALARDIDMAHGAGACLSLACETAGIELRTLHRWKALTGLVTGDGRPCARTPATP